MTRSVAHLGEPCGSVARRAEPRLVRLLEGEELNSRGDPGARARRNSRYSRVNEHSPPAAAPSVEKLAVSGAGAGVGGHARRPQVGGCCRLDRDSAAGSHDGEPAGATLEPAIT